MPNQDMYFRKISMTMIEDDYCESQHAFGFVSFGTLI